jgi:hypothetical protein
MDETAHKTFSPACYGRAAYLAALHAAQAIIFECTDQLATEASIASSTT